MNYLKEEKTFFVNNSVNNCGE